MNSLNIAFKLNITNCDLWSWLSECYIWISRCKWSQSRSRWCHYWQWVLATWVMSSYLNWLLCPPSHWSNPSVLRVNCRAIGGGKIWEVEIINTWMMILIFSNLQTHQYILSAKDIFRWRVRNTKKTRKYLRVQTLVWFFTKEFRNI